MTAKRRLSVLSLLAASVFAAGCAEDGETDSGAEGSGGTDTSSTSATTGIGTGSSGGNESATSTGTDDTDAGTDSTGTSDTDGTESGEDGGEIPDCGELHPAFCEFDDENVDVYLEGDNVVIETNGLPNHPTPYWGQGHAMYIEPTTTNEGAMTPSRIPGYDASATLRVPTSPQLAANPTATQLGAIGISVSGAALFNDQEGNGPLEAAAVSLDFTGAHIGPQEYHYHLEPHAWSNDDDKLIGILADGFFIYGRKESSTGTYPTDLDESGGHVGVTQHSATPEYHYHIENELYLNQYIIIFPGEYQGTPNSIN